MTDDCLNRREFLRSTGRVLAGATGLLLFSRCDSRAELDLVIKEALVVDGSGGRPFSADVGISGNYIKYIGKIGNTRARRVIEAKGLCLAPGFIDVHNHTDVQLLVCPEAPSLIRQGITTIVGGNCGASRFPLSPEMLAEENDYLRAEYGLEADWTDLQGFFRRLSRRGMAVNYATLVGQGTIRAAVVGYKNRQPTSGEMEKMKDLVRQALAQGAVGLSTGLEYAPGSFASTEELIELVQELKSWGGLYATHMRDEEDQVLEALEEAIDIAERTGVFLEISHLKVGYPRNWSKIDEVLSKIEEAEKSGIQLGADVYPYTAFATGLSIFFPLWVREGKKEDFLSRLKNPDLQPELKQAILQAEQNLGSWENVLISSVKTDRNRRYEGQNLQQAASQKKQDVFSFIRDLLIEEEGQVSMVCFAISEDNLKRLLQHPLTCLASDGELVSTEGPLARGRPHPRYCGSFPRAIARYVREEKLLPLEHMVRKMTALPAARFGFRRRGLIREGFMADLVIFDPEKIMDKATFTNPHQYPEGIHYVLVNGKLVVDEEEITGNLPGQILRREREGRV